MIATREVMFVSMRNVISIGILLALLPGIGQAIITGDNSAAEAAPSGLDWDYVYNYKNSSSVAVAPYWILTAAHVADDGPAGNLTIGETTYYQQEIIFHESADLALVRYDKELPGYYSLYTGTLLTGRDLLLVGYGNTGTVSTLTYTDSGSGSGTKRWGENEFSYSATVPYDAGGATGMTTNDMFFMAFNSSSKSQEAGVGVYDSGGGTFVYSYKKWKLAGINTIRGGSDPDYSGTYAVSVSDYNTWITVTMANATDDDDSDGIPNEWEYAQSGSTVGVDDSADPDDDGLTNLEEYQNDTDPDDSDSDDDSLPDGWEVLYGLDPLDELDAGQDLDSDTLVNSNEYLLGTDPTNPDMDGDAVLDGWEYHGTSNTAYGSESTSITNADSDADGLLDGVEMGITNSNGTITNPNSADTDGDSIPDAWEVENGLDPADDSNGENDSDADGFTDFQEWIADTNPTNETSFLKIDGFVLSSNQTVMFNGSTARKYQVSCTTNDLADTNLTWIAAQSPVPGIGPNSSITVTNTEDRVFYRVEASLP
jgi:hypothetical protein